LKENVLFVEAEGFMRGFMDELTTRLHMADIEKFINIIENIVDNRNTVIIIEHNIDIIKRSDWIIDLGPEGGTRDGKIIFEAEPSFIYTIYWIKLGLLSVLYNLN